MNSSKKRNGIIIVLLALVLVVWGLGLAGWVKGSSGSASLFKKGSSDTLETQIIEETTPIEPPVQTLPPKELDETPVETPSPLELDVSGVWDMTFHRYYSIENEGSWESIGMEEIFLWMEIHPGKQFECDIMPYEGTINGESYADSFAIEPQLHTGEVVGNTLRLYLDLDNFYLDPALEVSDTIQPDYIEIPITAENIRPSGTYDFTWVAVVDDGTVISGNTKVIGNAYNAGISKGQASVRYLGIFPYFNALESDTALSVEHVILLAVGIFLITVNLRSRPDSNRQRRNETSKKGR